MCPRSSAARPSSPLSMTDRSSDSQWCVLLPSLRLCVSDCVYSYRVPTVRILCCCCSCVRPLLLATMNVYSSLLLDDIYRDLLLLDPLYIDVRVFCACAAIYRMCAGGARRTLSIAADCCCCSRACVVVCTEVTQIRIWLSRTRWLSQWLCIFTQEFAYSRRLLS